jgi:hypothetical protein
MRGGSTKASKLFFFEKKNQKTFVCWLGAAAGSDPNLQKFFGSFFQKRTPSLSALIHLPRFIRPVRRPQLALEDLA